MPRPADIHAARARIAASILNTPLERSATLSDTAGVPIHLKLECWQRTRSFKVRGAFNAVASLTPAQRARGLVTASAGNHGQAVAMAARELGARATIFVPGSAPATKQARIRRLGAELRTDSADYDDAERQAREHAAETGAVFVHAFSDEAVIAGQGTIGLEVLDVLPDAREIVVPVGGGGLITGVGVAAKSVSPDIRVIGVQSVETHAMHSALQAGAVVDVPVTPTLADGLAGCTDDATFQSARAVIDEMVLVEEREIADAIRSLQRDDGVTAEGSGAVGVAALLAGRITLRGPAVVIITGGNIDPATLASVLAPG